MNSKVTKSKKCPRGHILMMSKMVKGIVKIHKRRSEIARFVIKILWDENITCNHKESLWNTLRNFQATSTGLGSSYLIASHSQNNAHIHHNSQKKHDCIEHSQDDTWHGARPGDRLLLCRNLWWIIFRIKSSSKF